MCGIVGVSLDFITIKQLNLVERVLRESEVRGMHASGLVWHDGEKLSRVSEPKPINQLLNENPALIDLAVTHDQCLNFIGHTRYSTSDLAFNQPIVGDDLAIAHNGVISQNSPCAWESEFDLKVSTRNDSELILRALQKGEDPIEKFSDASIAYVSINKWGDVSYARNGKRPLWITNFRNGFIITSTKDIMLRASDGAHIPIMIFPAGKGEELQ
jgi:glutamine phosphoribosylpyrophosphate amidotransferase